MIPTYAGDSLKKKRMLEISHRIWQSNFHQGPEGNVFDKLTVLNE